MTTTSEQYVLLVEMEATGGCGPAITEAIGNKGATRSLINLDLALRLGLPMQLARGSEYGTYFGRGYEECPYAGRIAGPVTLCFGWEVAIEL